MKRNFKWFTLIVFVLIVVMALVACSKVEFKVEFMVDGQVYYSINTNGKEVIRLPENPVKDGYEFDGWYWDNGVWQQPFTANSLLEAPLSSNMQVYAKWLAPGDARGTDARFSTLEQTGEREYTLTVPNATASLSLANLVTVATNSTWKLTSDMAGNNVITSKTLELQEGDNVCYVFVEASNGDSQLYTIRIHRRAMFTVTFDSQGGSAVEAQRVEEGQRATAPATNPTKSGYIFARWNFDFNTAISADVTVQAVWNEAEYQIVYNLNEGANAQGNPETFTKSSATINLAAPTRAGYDFEGWYTSENFAEDTAISSIATGHVGNVTLYAKWAVSKYTYRLGSLNIPDNLNAFTIDYDAYGDMLAYSTDTLYAYDFRDADHNSFKIVPSMAAGAPIDITTTLAQDPTLVEKWSIEPMYYHVTRNETGAYFVASEDLAAQTGIVDRWAIYQFEDKYQSLIDSGDAVRVDKGDGIPQTNRIFRIPLKRNLKFDNGDPITAQTFVDSFRLLTAHDSKFANAKYFFDDETLGDKAFVIQGVPYRYYENDVILKPADAYFHDSDWDTTDTDHYGLTENRQNGLVFVMDENSTAGETMQYYAKYYNKTVAQMFATIYGDVFDIPTADLANIFLAMEGKSIKQILESTQEFQYVSTNDSTNKVATLKSVLEGTVESQIAGGGPIFELFAVKMVYSETDLGFYAEDDYNLVIVLPEAMTVSKLMHKLVTSFMLVNPTFYNSCIETVNHIERNTYGTAADKYVGYGPYKLTAMSENGLTFVKNPLWHGYSQDEYVAGTYQASGVEIVKVASKQAELGMLLAGGLDIYELAATDDRALCNTEYTIRERSEMTDFIIMNPQLAKLTALQSAATPQTEGNIVVKTVFLLEDFRKALSFSIDRQAYINALAPQEMMAISLISESYIYNDYDSYRSTDEAKDALLSFWGLENQWGAGKKYATRDEALASVTGYDLAGAKVLFERAFNQAKTEGYITQSMINDGKWEVQIVLNISNGNTDYYNNGFDFLKNAWMNAIKGTPFEGHLVVIKAEAVNTGEFIARLNSGDADLTFGIGWTGSFFDVYGYAAALCVDGWHMDSLTIMDDIMLDVALDLGDGVKTYRASLNDWGEALTNDIDAPVVILSEVGEDGELNGNTSGQYLGEGSNVERRLAIVAAIDEKVMNLSNVFPIATRATASVTSQRTETATDVYVYGIGFGGVKYTTFSMSDKGYAAFVEAEGGTLDFAK